MHLGIYQKQLLCRIMSFGFVGIISVPTFFPVAFSLPTHARTQETFSSFSTSQTNVNSSGVQKFEITIKQELIDHVDWVIRIAVIIIGAIWGIIKINQLREFKY